MLCILMLCQCYRCIPHQFLCFLLPQDMNLLHSNPYEEERTAVALFLNSSKLLMKIKFSWMVFECLAILDPVYVQTSIFQTCLENSLYANLTSCSVNTPYVISNIFQKINEILNAALVFSFNRKWYNLCVRELLWWLKIVFFTTIPIMVMDFETFATCGLP